MGIEHPDDAWAILGAALSEAAAHEDTPDAEFTETERATRPENVPQAVPEAPVQQLADPVRQAPEPERAAPPSDYSDREFVFSPPPVLPTLPSQANQASQPSQPNQMSQPAQGNPPRQERGRSQRGGRRQQAGAETAQTQTAQTAAPEIVMSQSFQRPAQAAQEQDEQAGGALSPQAGADQWPEEAAAQTEVFAAAELAEADAAQTTGQPPVQLSVPAAGSGRPQPAIFRSSCRPICPTPPRRTPPAT